jgi:hypothetical protein
MAKQTHLAIPKLNEIIIILKDQALDSEGVLDKGGDKV